MKKEKRIRDTSYSGIESNFKSKDNPPEMKEEFEKRMKELLSEKKDYQDYLDILKIQPVKSIRCNTLKISVEELKERLKARGWTISQPWDSNPEVMIVENEVAPGEVGRAEEHLLGYYYMQELASMLPIIALKIQEGDLVLDLAAAPGSKTTQAAAEMENSGTIIANEISMPRLKILAANLERCGVTNTIMTRKEGAAFCERVERYIPNLRFDKILLDAPCSGEGTLRSSYKTYKMWNIKTVKSLPHTQRKLFRAAFAILKEGGEMIYSTCTHAPEENEAIVNWALKEFGNSIEVQEAKLPIKCRNGLTKWQDEEYDKRVKNVCRVYPQDNNTEGFFISKFRRVKQK